MTNRERIKAIFNYKDYDRLPVVHFGYWEKTLEKWCDEKHIKRSEVDGLSDGNEKDRALAQKLGFDFNWLTAFGENTLLMPKFEREILEELPDGKLKIINTEGLIVLEKPGVTSIPAQVDYLLKNRKVWEEYYLPKLQYKDERVSMSTLKILAEERKRENILGIYCGSLFGSLRDLMGVQGVSYLYADDEGLYNEIINTIGELSFKVLERILSIYSDFDFAHFWEDICFKNGPLVNPSVFYEKVGPHYKRITDLLGNYGINIVSVDCDGKIDSLIPTWIENGVNTMFPIEVGTWGADIRPWREKYGRKLRGVGGMDKKVFGYDYAAIDKEIERLRPLVEIGGYIPCPDHRIPPDAKWENVQYYCDRMRKVFG
ncbi:MAG: uroporphyrinogen decarboxylase family protein [Candidatus Humimicrobiaceae bacterium]